MHIRLVFLFLFISSELLAVTRTPPKDFRHIALSDMLYRTPDKAANNLAFDNPTAVINLRGMSLTAGVMSYAAANDTTETVNVPIDTIIADTTDAAVAKRDTTVADTTVSVSAKVDSTEVDTTVVDTTVVKKEKINYWTKTNTAGINLNEVAFINWNSGGNNSISALTHAKFGRRYKKNLLNWNSEMSIRYGLNAQQGRELRKTEDQLQINSNFGYRKDSVSNWYYSAKLDFNTQLTVGYRYPDTSTPISKFMAPGYAFLGVGTEYSSPTENFTAYVSPVTQKSTFVLDQRLANEGRFGVIPAVYDEEGNIIEEGEKIRSEFGFLMSGTLNRPVSENIRLNSRMRLYSDYLNKFGNIDIDWEINFDMRVNEYVRANVGSHIKYDDDVKFQEDRNGDGELETVGPKVQFKQILGVGLVYDF